jgi:hypothetical protein
MKNVTATLGPYRGYVMNMADDEAAQAIADRWAVAQTEPPFDLAVDPNDYPILTDDERRTAEHAARVWGEAFLKLFVQRG